MEKSELKHGMRVRNKKSRNIGIVWNPKGGRLGCVPECVHIRWEKRVGKKQRLEYTIWDVENLEPAPEE